MSVFDRLDERSPLPLVTDPQRSSAPGVELAGLNIRACIQAWLDATDDADLDQAFALACTETGGIGQDPVDLTMGQRVRMAPGIKGVFNEGELIVQGEAYPGLTLAQWAQLNHPQGLATQGLSDDAMALIDEFAEEGWICLTSSEETGWS